MSRIIKSKTAAETSARKILIKQFTQHIETPPENTSHELEIEENKKIAHVEQTIEDMLLQAEKEAQQIKNEAVAYADQISEQVEQEKEQAHTQIEEATRIAREQGYKEGFLQGEIDGKKTYDQLIEQAKTVIAQSEKEYEKNIDQAGPVIIELATALTKKIIGNELDVHSEVWLSLLKQVMNEVREQEHVKLYVHPNWYENTIKQKDELEQLLSHTENLYIYPDAGLPENGCVVESQYGRIDATVDRQLQELKSQLIEKWGERTSGNRGTEE